MSFGFILTRHVNSEKTNEYWNHSVKLIRSLYPFRKIVVIDDNSNQDFVKAEFDYKNVEIIQSEYPGRGELLPFVYYARNKWFDKAIIIHDSVFFHKRIPFEKLSAPVMYFWHHSYDKENLDNILRISSFLSNNLSIKNKLKGDSFNILGLTQKRNFELCFGGMCFIKHDFLMNLENKYKLSNLVKAVKCRTDRCAMERILGVLFTIEYGSFKSIKSLYGEIFNQYRAFNYNYDDYIRDFKNKQIHSAIVKVWSGR